MRRSVHYRAPAKLNLALSVGPPLPPEEAEGTPRLGATAGMHPICSWMITVDLFDDLHLTRLEDDRLSRYAILWHADAKRRSDIHWSITRDLAVRAHLALQERIGRALPVQMKLQKRIPVGGGLGGGSSDAAAMLRAANDLFDLGLSLDELATIGASLGSDIPFLVRGGSAIVEGLGEQITTAPWAPQSQSAARLHAVIAFPNVACPTKAVYQRFDELQREAKLRSQMVKALASGGLKNLSNGALFNDLTAAAIDVAPQLADDLAALSALAQRPACVSGSGSSIFVVCDDELHAQSLAEMVERKCELPAVAVKSWPAAEV